MKEMFISLIAMMVVVSSMLLYVYNGPSWEERWEVEENTWQLKQTKWAKDHTELMKLKQQIDLTLSYRVIDHKQLTIEPYSEDTGHAIVTIFSVEDYEMPGWIPALIFFQSLEETNTRIKNKIAFSLNRLDLIPQYVKDSFERLGVSLRFLGLPPRNPPSQDWREIWSRTTLFSLTEFSRILFVDSTSLIIDNIDHVLDSTLPLDLQVNDANVVFAALRQPECKFFEPCGERRTASPYFFMLSPNEIIGSEVQTRINKKSDEVILDDMLTFVLGDVLVWTPFHTDSFAWELGECECDQFLNRNVKSIYFSCLQVQDIFNDVIGIWWTQKSCSFEWFVIWLRLYSELFAKEQR